MTYKHENDVIDAVDFMKPSYGTGKHKAIQVEVGEVYRKAEAWDKLEFILEGEIVEANPVYSNNGTKKADAPINVKIEAWESILMSMQDLVGSIKSEEDK